MKTLQVVFQDVLDWYMEPMENVGYTFDLLAKWLTKPTWLRWLR